MLEPDAMKMGLEVTHGITEKGIIRLIKVAAGVNTLWKTKHTGEVQSLHQ